MRTTTFILGLAGGAAGILLGLVAMTTEGLFDVPGAGPSGVTIMFALTAVAAAIGAIVCAFRYRAAPSRGMAWALVALGVWHLLAITVFGVVGGFLIIGAGICGLLGAAPARYHELVTAGGAAGVTGYCPQCGHRTDARAHFCASCGTSLDG